MCEPVRLKPDESMTAPVPIPDCDALKYKDAVQCWMWADTAARTCNGRLNALEIWARE